MNPSMIIEMVGYLGSALVVISMLMSSVIKLRVINTVGSCIFAAYALIIQSYPTAIMNFCLVAINVYNLVKLLRTDRQYDLVEGRADDCLIGYFLNHYREDIRVYFPHFQWEPSQCDVAYMILCNANPAGILLGRKGASGEIEISLEYTTPVYRDCSVGRFLYDSLREAGIPRLSFPHAPGQHEAYLLKMGYVRMEGGYVKELLMG